MARTNDDQYTPEEIAHLLGETRRKADRQLMLDSTIVEAANALDTPITLEQVWTAASTSKLITWGASRTEVMESIGRILIGRWKLTDTAQEGLKNIAKLGD